MSASGWRWAGTANLQPHDLLDAEQPEAGPLHQAERGPQRRCRFGQGEELGLDGNYADTDLDMPAAGAV